MASIRQRIILSVQAGLASITTANGYQTNIGAGVYLCRKNVDKSKFPCIVVWPQQETGGKVQGRVKAIMPVSIIAGHAIGPDEDPEDIEALGEQLLSDLRKRIESQTANITGGLADHIEYRVGGVDSYPDPGDTVLNCAVVYEITYKTLIANPHQQ